MSPAILWTCCKQCYLDELQCLIFLHSQKLHLSFSTAIETIFITCRSDQICPLQELLPKQKSSNGLRQLSITHCFLVLPDVWFTKCWSLKLNSKLFWSSDGQNNGMFWSKTNKNPTKHTIMLLLLRSKIKHAFFIKPENLEDLGKEFLDK